jgi:ABC-type antimicrobial peptide transport system permease subunit
VTVVKGTTQNTEIVHMLTNYVKIAWRHLAKAKFHSAINILGLSIGIGFTLLIAAYVWGELQVNKHLRNADRQYIIQSNWTDPNMGLNLTTVGPLAKALHEQYPDLVKNYYRWDGVTSTVSKGDRIFREGLQIGDSTLLTMYGFKLLYGDGKTALNDPFSVVITEDRAIKYFGKKDVVGEMLTIESFSGSKHDFKITGVLQKPSDNSVIHLTPDNDNQVYIPTASIDYFSRSLDSWNNPYMVAYVELQPNVKPSDLQRPMQTLLKNNAPADMAANMRPFLAPLSTYYLNQFDGLVRKMLLTVSVIALFILLMAVINFINITIGKSSTRIKEIGVRKVMGSRQRQLIFQFLTESILVVTLSTLAGIAIYMSAAPVLTDLLGKTIPSVTQFPPAFIGVLALFVLTVGVLAGLYPAFVLARLNTTDSVKGKMHSINANILFRKTLVGFQICTASVVFIGALITMQQVNLFFSKDLGYDKDWVVAVQTPRDWTPKGVQHMITVRNELKALPQATEVSLSWAQPDGRSSGSTMVYPQGKDSTGAIAMESIITDENYLPVFKVPLLAGRYFRDAADSLSVVINASAVKAFGFSSAHDAVGKKAYLPGRFEVTIAGVVNDFHFGSMKLAIQPLLITNVSLNNLFRILCFRLKPGNIAASMDAIQKKWSALMPGSAFEYKFMDESLATMYASEIRLKKAAQLAVVLALTIVLLGVAGLISVSVQKRTKEIGIRKVVGATLANIISLFLKDFLPVVFIGGVVSIPLSWLLMQSWLNEYAYRVPMTPLPFLLSIAAIGAVTTVLIAVQIAKLSAADPVKNLRTE